jgi:hypothetical protein
VPTSVLVNRLCVTERDGEQHSELCVCWHEEGNDSYECNQIDSSSATYVSEEVDKRRSVI